MPVLGNAAGGTTVRTTEPLKYRLPKPGVVAKTEPIGRAKTNVATTKSETIENFFKENSPPKHVVGLFEHLPTLGVLAKSGVDSIEITSGSRGVQGFFTPLLCR